MYLKLLGAECSERVHTVKSGTNAQDWSTLDVQKFKERGNQLCNRFAPMSPSQGHLEKLQCCGLHRIPRVTCKPVSQRDASKPQSGLQRSFSTLSSLTFTQDGSVLASKGGQRTSSLKALLLWLCAEWILGRVSPGWAKHKTSGVLRKPCNIRFSKTTRKDPMRECPNLVWNHRRH